MQSNLQQRSAFLCLCFFTIAFSGCSDKSASIVNPGEEISQEHWWDNYLDQERNPLTLPSGFKLAAVNGTQRQAALLSSQSGGIRLNFAIDPFWRSNLGYIFRGNDQNNANLENQAGAVEFIKQSGWLVYRETFDWEGLKEDPPGSFKFVRVNRFTKLQIRTTFLGVATDLMQTLLGKPYIGYPADTTKTWNGMPVQVSDGSGREFQEILSYRIRYLGTKSLVEGSGKNLATFDDVILIQGRANQGEGRVDAYLAPDAGIIYYYLVTAFGQPAAGALVGYSCENLDSGGSPVKDYFPTAPGNHWIYEFAPDNAVEAFRFSVR